MKQELVFEAPRRAMPPRHFADLDDGARVAAVTELGLPAFRAKQLANQYFGRLTADPAAMTDLPAAVRAQVADALFPILLTPARQVECDAGETRKTLWRAVDGTTFESVLMRYPGRDGSAGRATVCISSQAGCGMACPFCATGQGGLNRNLSVAEILEQVRAAASELRDERGERLSNIVFMGMGEPLANYNRVLSVLRRIIAAPPNGFGISARSVTVSTVGLAPAIRRLADEGLGVTLALSLHAPDDELRNTLVILLSDNGPEGNDIGQLPMNRLWIPLAFDNDLDNIGRVKSYTWTGPGWALASSGPFRLYKTFASEGGIRVPAVVSWPARIPAQRRLDC